MSATTDCTAGLMLLDDIESVSDGLANGDWLSVTFGTVSTVSSMLDPIGTLFENGIGWLLEYLEPLASMLDELTGDPAQVQSLAQSWSELGAGLLSASEDVTVAIRSDLAEFEGLTFEVYRQVQSENSALIATIGDMCESVRAALENASQMVQTVHDIVRDVIATIVGMILSALATIWIPVIGVGRLIGKAIEAVLELGPIASRAVDAIKHAFGLLQDLLGQATNILRNIPGAEMLASAGLFGRRADDVVDVGKHSDDVLASGKYVTRELGPNSTGEDLLTRGNRYDSVDGRPYSFEARSIQPSSADLPYTQMDFGPDSLPTGWKFQVSEVAEGLGHPGGAMQFQVIDESGRFLSMADLLNAGRASTW